MRRFLLLVVAAATGGGCDDVIFGAGGVDVPVDQDGYAGVQAIVESACVTCHSSGPVGNSLDLATDLHGATVGVPSSQDADWILVQPGEPESSLLYLKVTGQAPSETGGADMPPGTGGIDPAAAEIIESWI